MALLRGDATAQARSAVPKWTVDARPVWRSGGVTGSGPLEWNGIGSALRLSSGEVVVADEGAREVRVVDARGGYLRTLIRRGHGPAELDQLDRMFVVNDTVLVMEGSHAVQVVVPASGVSKRTVLPSMAGHLRGVAVAAMTGGALVVQLRKLDLNGGGREPTFLRDSLRFAMLRLSDSSWRFLAAVPDVPRYSVAAGVAPVYPIGFAPTAQVDGGIGVFCAGFTARYEVTCLDTAGRRVGGIRGSAAPGRRVTEADKRAFRLTVAGLREDGTSKYGGSLGEHRRRVAEAARFADQYPAFAQLLVARDGLIWMREFAPDDGLSERRTRANRRPSEWRIWDLRGHEVATCTLPERFAPTDIGSDYVLGVARDEEDVEELRLYVLRKR